MWLAEKNVSQQSREKARTAVIDCVTSTKYHEATHTRAHTKEKKKERHKLFVRKTLHNITTKQGKQPTTIIIPPRNKMMIRRKAHTVTFTFTRGEQEKPKSGFKFDSLSPATMIFIHQSQVLSVHVMPSPLLSRYAMSKTSHDATRQHTANTLTSSKKQTKKKSEDF